MRLIKKVGYVKASDLGSDNVMLFSSVGPYLMKKSDFSARKSEEAIIIYPVVEETKQTGMVPKYLAVLSKEDYDIGAS